MARDQLSVKQYLIVIAIAGTPFLLGGLYTMVVTASISADPAKVRQRIVVRGRYPAWWGENYLVCADKQEHDPSKVRGGPNETMDSYDGVATRGWLGEYRFRITVDPVKEPGEYRIWFLALQSQGSAHAAVNVSP